MKITDIRFGMLRVPLTFVLLVRRGVGRGLIALGTWLDPAAGRQAQGVPALQG